MVSFWFPLKPSRKGSPILRMIAVSSAELQMATTYLLFSLWQEECRHGASVVIGIAVDIPVHKKSIEPALAVSSPVP